MGCADTNPHEIESSSMLYPERWRSTSVHRGREIPGALEAASSEIKSVSTSSHEILAAKCDVRKLSDVQSWLKSTVDKFGKLDGAVNLAGVTGRTKQCLDFLMDQDEDEWDFIIAVNLTGAMHCIKEELKLMGKGGSIINSTSISGLYGFRGAAAYVATKHGVIGLTKTAAKENAARGIRVNCVAPGHIDTPMLQGTATAVGEDKMDASVARVPIARKANPEEVSNVIAFLLSDEASFVTGATYSVDGGMNC